MPELTLNELSRRGVLSYSDGYRTKRSEHGRPGYRILRVADVLDGQIKTDSDDYVRYEFSDAIGSKRSQVADVLLTTKGTVGRVAIYPSEAEQVVYSPQLCFFRITDTNVVEPRFLAYWFKSPAFQAQAAHRANNTDMAPYINLADIGSVRVILPSVTTQRAIGQMLGALDDKIATNHRLSRTLLELSDAVFARTAGRVPTNSLTFGDVAEIGGGGTPRTSVDGYWGGEIRWTTPTDVTGLTAPYLFATSRTITSAGLSACASALYPAGSILMTSRATVGAFAIAQVPVAVNQGFIVVNARDRNLQWWLFHNMRSRVIEFLSYANGATFLELPRGRFKSLLVDVPEPRAVDEFNATVAPLHATAAGLTQETERLAATRDELLPLLMSGEVRVKDAERAVGEVL